jgi:hypothetical protein
MKGMFTNAIICEDVRDEVGNKKSLMGVFSGDIVVAEFPAIVRIAFYAEYILDVNAGPHELSFSIEVGGEEAASGRISIDNIRDRVATLIVPQGLATIAEPCDIALTFTGEGATRELIRKAVRLRE